MVLGKMFNSCSFHWVTVVSRETDPVTGDCWVTYRTWGREYRDTCAFFDNKFGDLVAGNGFTYIYQVPGTGVPLDPYPPLCDDADCNELCKGCGGGECASARQEPPHVLADSYCECYGIGELSCAIKTLDACPLVPGAGDGAGGGAPPAP
jgi:hypothetical protein